jgi:Glycosyl hydrolases family 18
MPEVGGTSETDRMSDAERTAGMTRPQADDRASEVRNWFQPARPAHSAEASPANARPANASTVRGSDTGSGSAERTETEPDTMSLPMLPASSPRAQTGTGRPPAAAVRQQPAKAKNVPSAPAPKTTRGYYSGSKSPAWPDALNETEPATVILPKLVVSRPPARNGTAAAGNGARTTAKTTTTGQRRPAEAVRPHVLAEPETMLLPVVPAGRSQGLAEPAAGRYGPAKFIAPPGRRLRRATGRHRPLIVALAAVAAIAAAATLISVRLDASPRPSGAPPMDIPSPSVGHQVARVATSSTWPATAPAAVPAGCKQVSLKGIGGASVVSYLDDNTSQRNLVATEAKGLDLLDFSWTSLAGPTDVVRTDSFDPSLVTELTAADQSGPCGLRFATLSDNDPAMSHSADVRMMTKILTSSSVRQAHVLAVAQWMASQPLATGLTIDYENGLPQNLDDLSTAEQVAGWSGLSLDAAVNRLSTDYTELIGEIAAAMHRQHRLVRLMAPVRDSDDVDAATTDIAPYLLEYGALAQYVDQIVLKAYDFSYATGNPGPVAAFADVAKVLAYVHSYNVPWSKLAVAEPMYAYDWTVNNNGDIAVNAKGEPTSAITLTATQVAAGKKQWDKVKTEDGETEYSYTRAGKKHIVWDASSALKAEMTWLKRSYAQIGIDASGIGNADPTGSALAVTALGG